MNTKKQEGFAHAIVPIVLAVVVVGILATVYVARTNNKASANTENNTETTALETAIPTSLASIDAIKSAVELDNPGVGITSVELSSENGTYLYKVKLANGTVLFFDATKATKIDHATGENEAEVGEIPTSFVAAVTYEQARTTALAQKTDSTIKTIELESENGVIVYKVKFVDGVKILINATTGTVVTTESDSKGDSGTSSSDKSTSDSGSSSSGSGSSSNSNSGSSSGSNSSSSDSSGDDSSNDSGSEPEDD